jgi:tetratricopeptide (TPR) repeat protein
MIRWITIMACLLISMYVPAHAQQEVLSESFKLAQTYERTGDMRNASRLYQELYAKRPSEQRYFEGVVRTLIALQQYTSLLPLIEQRMSTQPTFDLSVLEAQVAWRAGDQAHADRAWESAARIGAADEENTYAVIAESQAGLLLFQRAIASYQKARAASGIATSYCMPLSSLYAAVGDYRNGIRETMSVYEESDNQGVVQGRLSTFMLNDTAKAYVGTVLESADDTPPMFRLRAWYYRETKQWDKAVAQTMKLDEALRTNGQELLLFADAMRREGNLEVAQKAYTMIINTKSFERFKLSGLYGYARVMEQTLRTQPQLNDQQAKAIVEQYRSIITSYPQHPLAAEALYHMAVVTDEYLHDVDGAREMLMRLTNQYRGTTSAADGALYLATLYLVLDRTDLAASTLISVASLTQSNLSDQRDLALVRLGDIRFFEGTLDSALVYYRQAAERSGSAATNDALERMLIIELADRDTSAVRIFARAEFRALQRAHREAATLFAQAADSTRDADLRDRCRYQAAEQFLLSAGAGEAMKQLSTILDRVPDSIFGDKALFMSATIQEKVGDRTGAIQTLSILLAQYPRSILIPETRDRIRRLRGDA